MRDFPLMIYVLAYPQFSPKVSQSIAAFRSVHEPERARLVAPHITLVFGVKTVSPKDMSEPCKRAATTTPPISLEFSQSEISYDPFEKAHKICLICGAGADLVRALHEKLYKGSHRVELHPDIPYRPHMTVGTHPDLSKLQQADVTSIAPFPITAEINGLDVVSLKDGVLHSVSTFPFTM